MKNFPGCYAYIFIFFLSLIGAGKTAFNKPLVVTSFSILADWSHVLAGDFIEIKSVVGPNQDAHVFEPTPHTLTTLLKADLIVAYGFGFEGWFERLLQTMPLDKKIVYVSQGQQPRHLVKDDAGDVLQDPHGWHDLKRVSHNCQILATALQQLIPDKAHLIKENLKAYQQTLREINNQVKRLFQGLSEDQKIIITSHDGFGYYAAAYGLTILSPMGISTDSQPSAKAIAELIGIIRRYGIKRIFLENIANPKLIKQLAEETNTSIDGPLYSDALSKADGPAATFVDLFMHNSLLFHKAMQEIKGPASLPRSLSP